MRAACDLRVALPVFAAVAEIRAARVRAVEHALPAEGPPQETFSGVFHGQVQAAGFAACLEPVNQLSGYQDGCYVTPKDQSTNYYFYMLPQGKHTIESEYYIDREGEYQTGTCTIQCAYAPEFCGRAKSEGVIVKK